MSKEENKKNEDEKLETLRELIKGIDFGMLTTVQEDGSLHSRPMSTNGNVEFDGDLWFFACDDSHKIAEIERDARVNVAFSNPEKQGYASVSGTASLVRDKGKIKELWTPPLQAWFPDGPETEGIVLIKVEASSAEYWSAPGSAIAHVIAFAKAVVTRQTPDIGENETVKL